MYSGKMKVRRFKLVNAANGWPCHMLCVDREQNGKMVRTWSTNGQPLKVAQDGHHLVLPETHTAFVLPFDDGEGELG